jgi:metallophosphoesterase (TIGR00282 family)
MKILYLGDIMGEPGIRAVQKFLPKIEAEHVPDLVFAQAENVHNGRGITKKEYKLLQGLGIDVFTGGNWSLHNDDIHLYMNDPTRPITRPANYPAGTPGKQYKIVQIPAGAVLVVSLLGHIVGKDADVPTDNPLHVVDQILEETKHVAFVARIVNFHGDYSSEKRVIGYYLDGRVSAVIGDHWHVPTADAMVLPGGTAHITDVGMCGSVHSSLGVRLDSIVTRWKDNKQTRNILETEGPLQLNAVLIEIKNNCLASSIQQLQFCE